MADMALQQIAARPGLLGAVGAKLAAARAAFRAHRERRAIYVRTLRELESYKPHELVDLNIQTGDFEALAREQAGLRP